MASEKDEEMFEQEEEQEDEIINNNNNNNNNSNYVWVMRTKQSNLFRSRREPYQGNDRFSRNSKVLIRNDIIKGDFPFGGNSWLYVDTRTLDFVLDLNLLCPYCHIGLSVENASLDRIDNSKGHLLDNVIICCSPCNIARGDHYSVAEFIMLCRALAMKRELTSDDHPTSIQINFQPTIPPTLKQMVDHCAADQFEKIRENAMERRKTEFSNIIIKLLKKEFKEVDKEIDKEIEGWVRHCKWPEQIEASLQDFSVAKREIKYHMTGVVDQFKKYLDLL